MMEIHKKNFHRQHYLTYSLFIIIDYTLLFKVLASTVTL